MIKIVTGIVVAMALAACTTMETETFNACDNTDGALTNKGFVIVTSPVPGQRVSTGFLVKGCSVTFEANVPWQLLDSNGDIISEGYTTGGNLGIPNNFSFNVPYTIDSDQIGKLIVIEDDPSDSEGKPPINNEFPLILEK